jgi:hypothetical protein
MFCLTTGQLWLKTIDWIFLKGNREDFKFSQYKEKMHIWGNIYANYLDLIITHYIHVLKCHIVPNKYVQLLCDNLKHK